MKIALIEDEILALEKLERYLKKINHSIEVVAKLDSIQEAVTFFSTNPQIDLVFMDIQLTDGLSFEIFQQTQVPAAVIFTTAFDEFALDAFKVNSIDYLLKPITYTDLQQALHKFEHFQSLFTHGQQIKEVLPELTAPSYKDRFLVRIGNHIQSIPTDDVSLFYAEGRTVFLLTNTGKTFVVDYTLETIQDMVNPQSFFRVNRSFLIQMDGIKDVVVYSNSRLKVTCNVKAPKAIVVSREKVSRFKKWFEGK